jgi:hypothetical protein
MEMPKSIGFSFKKKVAKASGQLQAVFSQQEPEEDNMTVGRRKLDADSKAMLAAQPPVPTTKEGLYSYPIVWKIVDTFDLVNERVKPWLEKRIADYFGQPEPDLLNYISTMVSEHRSANEIQSELEPVLGVADAEGLVVNLWKRIIEISRG